MGEWILGNAARERKRDKLAEEEQRKRRRRVEPKREVIDLTEDEPTVDVVPILLQNVPTILEATNFVTASSLGSTSSASFSAPLVKQNAPRRPMPMPPTPAPMSLGGLPQEELDKFWIAMQLVNIKKHLKDEFTDPVLKFDKPTINSNGTKGIQYVRFEDERDPNYDRRNECWQLIIVVKNNHTSTIDIDHLKWPEQDNCLFSGPVLLSKLKNVADKLVDVTLFIGCDASKVTIKGIDLPLYSLQDLFYGQTFYNRQGFYTKSFDMNYLENEKYRSETKLTSLFSGHEGAPIERLYEAGKDKGIRMTVNKTIKEFGEDIKEMFGAKIQNTMNREQAMDLYRVLHWNGGILFSKLNQETNLIYIKNKILPKLINKKS